jgi:D-3-phosphoglycerate dehydrogenase
MNSWKIIITDKLEPNGQAILKDRAHVDDSNGISAEELISAIPNYDAVIVRSRTRLTPEVFSAGSRLRVAGRAGVGVDNIDLSAARANGVTVVNAPTGTTTAVAEHTLALMLALARAIPRADNSMKLGQWHKKELMGTELADKTLGVIGAGRIGAQVAARATAFGMRVLGYDPLENEEEVRARGFEPVTLAEIYAKSDFISLHTPLTPETLRMIDGQALARMKAGVYLICTARGGIIDETALAAALESGQVAGAALDVFAQEPPGLSALVAHPHLIATPHIASQTKEAQARTAALIAGEVLAALAGEPLRWRIV